MLNDEIDHAEEALIGSKKTLPPLTQHFVLAPVVTDLTGTPNLKIVTLLKEANSNC
jgi:hypothetical protein